MVILTPLQDMKLTTSERPLHNIILMTQRKTMSPNTSCGGAAAPSVVSVLGTLMVWLCRSLALVMVAEAPIVPLCERAIRGLPLALVLVLDYKLPWRGRGCPGSMRVYIVAFLEGGGQLPFSPADKNERFARDVNSKLLYLE